MSESENGEISQGEATKSFSFLKTDEAKNESPKQGYPQLLTFRGLKQIY